MNPDPLRVSLRLRRTAVGAAAAIAVAAVGTVWLVAGDEPARPTVAELPVGAPVVEEPRLALAPTAAASGADIAVGVESPGEVQMCGGAWVRLKDDGDVDWDSVAAASKESTDALTSTVVAAMTSSADEQARAAAIAIAMNPTGRALMKPSACEGDTACERDLNIALKEWQERRDALAKLAQDSADPTVYAWAVRACGITVKEGPGHCQLISAAQWARLDPANAAPWIAVAMNAQAEKDRAAVDDALFRISVAERYDPGDYRIGLVLLDHVPDSEANLWAALTLVAQGIGFDAAAAIGEIQSLASLCPAKELNQDNARSEACERSAEVLVRSSMTLNGLMAGRMIGKRVGWPQERIDGLQKESGALKAAWERESPTGSESLSCKALRAQLDSVREFAAHGQVAALRRRVGEPAVRTVASTSLRSGVSGPVPPR
ncbi:MAG: hypothetical protein K8R60_21345 [Burkholderiales bacterium]|nr:hypothetical protein [Burkholderiales bacterium]